MSCLELTEVLFELAIHVREANLKLPLLLAESCIVVHLLLAEDLVVPDLLCAHLLSVGLVQCEVLLLETGDPVLETGDLQDHSVNAFVEPSVERWLLLGERAEHRRRAVVVFASEVLLFS